MTGDTSLSSRSVWPLPRFYFRVSFDDIDPQFQRVAGLDVETQTFEHRTGNRPIFSAFKMPGIEKHSNVTLKKGILPKADDVWAWLNAIKTNKIMRANLPRFPFWTQPAARP
ncbi:phage tail protein [Roseovarius aestuariivivens]|uniref:phage tail protein n=1 Tax=Roseovarius aestuariivivens TaxID=1888910 RepID=UPI001AEC24E4|nr:phage tail protein [Roseovarius aestuariivivens]